MSFQNLLVHLFNSIINIFRVDEVDKCILSLHDNIFNLTELFKDLFKIISVNASADTPYVNLGRLCNRSLLLALSGLAATSIAVMVASVVVI